MQRESAESSTVDLDTNYSKLGSTIIHLPVLFPSANPPCLHQAGPQSGISSPVDSHIYPRKERKGKRGLQRHSLPMKYGRPFRTPLPVSPVISFCQYDMYNINLGRLLASCR